MTRLLEPTGNIRRCLNLGSYNYLGFAAADEYCTPRVLHALDEYGWSMSASRSEAGVVSGPAYAMSFHPTLRSLLTRCTQVSLLM